MEIPRRVVSAILTSQIRPFEGLIPAEKCLFIISRCNVLEVVGTLLEGGTQLDSDRRLACQFWRQAF